MSKASENYTNRYTKLKMRTLLILILTTSTLNSFAGKMMFGKDQNIHIIEPKFEIPLMDAKGYQLTDSLGTPIRGKLAYLVEIQFFIAGVWVTDGGYILTNDKKTFYSISESEQKIIEESINKEFPSYSLSVFDYLFGYSLWLILAGVIGYYKMKDVIRNKKHQNKNVV